MNEPKRRVRRSRAEEDRISRAMGGSRQPRSGGYWGRKGDVVTARVMVEHKMTDKASISIKDAWLKKNFDEATAEGKVPYLGIKIGGRDYMLLEEATVLEFDDIISALRVQVEQLNAVIEESTCGQVGLKKESALE